MYLKIFFIILFIFTGGGEAYAYLDPGTGSFIVQALLAVLAAVSVSISIFLNKLKNFFKNFFKKKKNK
jgi:hypothetical protein